MAIKGIIFDFDGVILESVDIKTRAFAALFSDYPQHKEAIVNFHLKNGGMSRFDKFKIIYRDILKEPLSQEKFSYLCKRFAELVFEEILKCEFVKGAEDTLRKYTNRYLLFVVSATPDKEIKEIVAQKGLQGYFKAIYGAPLSKNEAIENILRDFKLKREEVIFVGDALNDHNAALASNIKFVGRLHRDNNNLFDQLTDISLIEDLYQLQEIIP
jgi:HAD superfamily hydrolase (TIGR01549 family)